MKIVTQGQRVATAAQIRLLEAQVGSELPVDYVGFLRQYNGGAPDPSTFDISGSRWFDEDQIEYFLELGSDKRYVSILGTMEDMESRLPFRHIPIAHSVGGAMLVLCCIGGRFGSIWYWDPDDLASDGGPAVWPVTNSFSELLNSLRESERDEPGD